MGRGTGDEMATAVMTQLWVSPSYFRTRPVCCVLCLSARYSPVGPRYSPVSPRYSPVVPSKASAVSGLRQTVNCLLANNCELSNLDTITSRAGDISLRSQPKLVIDVETKRRVVRCEIKGNNDRTKRATLEKKDIVTRTLEDFVSANTLRFFEILGLPQDLSFNLDP